MRKLKDVRPGRKYLVKEDTEDFKKGDVFFILEKLYKHKILKLESEGWLEISNPKTPFFTLYSVIIEGQSIALLWIKGPFLDKEDQNPGFKADTENPHFPHTWLELNLNQFVEKDPKKKRKKRKKTQNKKVLK